MSHKLLQTHPIKGTREFALVDDEIHYSVKSLIKKTETLSVVLSALDAEPVIADGMLAFVSKVNREPLVELFLDRPDKTTFDEFVRVMRQRILDEDFSLLRPSVDDVEVSAERLAEAMDMLRTYVDPAEIEALLTAMAELLSNPADKQCLMNVADEFNRLGFVKGQVITYAPYISFMLSGNKPGGF